jgi:signal peptidase II
VQEDERSAAPPRATLTEQSLLLLVAAGAIIADQVSKLVVEQQLALNRSWAPFPEYAHLFRITHVSNTGAAFGLFPSGSLLFGFVAAIVSVLILFYNYRLTAGHRLLRAALGLQMGGALGNLIDRLRIGHVTDFLDFGPWPVFNLADLWIVSGVVLLGLLMLHEERAALRARRALIPPEDHAAAPLSPLPRPSKHEPTT